LKNGFWTGQWRLRAYAWTALIGLSLSWGLGGVAAYEAWAGHFDLLRTALWTVPPYDFQLYLVAFLRVRADGVGLAFPDLLEAATDEASQIRHFRVVWVPVCRHRSARGFSLPTATGIQ
jgi:hypothetical protein